MLRIGAVAGGCDLVALLEEGQRRLSQRIEALLAGAVAIAPEPGGDAPLLPLTLSMRAHRLLREPRLDQGLRRARLTLVGLHRALLPGQLADLVSIPRQSRRL